MWALAGWRGEFLIPQCLSLSSDVPTNSPRWVCHQATGVWFCCFTERHHGTPGTPRARVPPAPFSSFVLSCLPKLPQPVPTSAFCLLGSLLSAQKVHILGSPAKHLLHPLRVEAEALFALYKDRRGQLPGRIKCAYPNSSRAILWLRVANESLQWD